MKKQIIILLLVLFPALQSSGCALYAYMSEEGLLIGRNFDWLQRGGTVEFVSEDRVYGVPTKRFIQLQQMGSDRPFEGINSSGLFIAMAAVVDSPIQEDFNAEKPLIDALGLMRLVLERAENTEQAIALMSSFKIDYYQAHNYPKAHYMIADPSGKVAIYEEGKDVIMKTLSAGESLSLTNFQVNSQIPCERLNALNEFIHTGEKSPVEEMFDAMNEAYVETTIWTSIYNLNEKNISLAIEEDRDIPIKIGFDDFQVYHRSVDLGELKMRFTNPFNH